jgi:hypothetical protein
MKWTTALIAPVLLIAASVKLAATAERIALGSHI